MMPPEMPSHTDRTIDRIVGSINNDKALTEHDLIDVYTVASVDFRLAEYRQTAKEMSVKERLDEQHNSATLANNMTTAGDPRPAPASICHAHHIISGKHPNAVVLRALLAVRGRRIDDAINGAWLPNSTQSKAKMPRRLRNAVPHSRIHRDYYYRWLGGVITKDTAKDLKTLDSLLARVAFQLQSSTFPSTVMNPKGK